MSVLLVCLSFCARRSLFVGLGGRLPRKCATVSFVVGQSFISLQPLTIATSCMPTTVSCMSCIWQESEGTWRTSSTTAHYTEMFRRMVSNRSWTRISSSPQRSGQLKVSPRPEPKWLRLFLSKGVRLALALSHSRSLSLSLYRAWGRQQRPGCLPRADTHTRVPWQVGSPPRVFRTEGLGCTWNGLTRPKRKRKEKTCSPRTASSEVPRTFKDWIEDELEPPPPNSSWGALKRNEDYRPGRAQD